MSDEKVASNPIFAFVLLVGVSLGLLPWSLTALRPSSEDPKPSSNASSAKGVFLVDVFDPIRQDLGCAGCPRKECPCKSVKFVIALVPDPDADGQASTYDEFLSTIEHAASDGGHTYIGHAIPRWKEEQSSSSGRPRSSFHQPGSLVFRADPPKTGKYDYLVVLLIIESPIRGISIEAFTNAVRQLRCPDDPFDSCDQQPLRIVGPSYSGTRHTLIQSIDSAYSLYLAKGWSWPGARVVTGSATAMQNLFTVAPGVDWFRTVHTVDEALRTGAIEKYLHTNLSNLVILAESETAFGSSVIELGNQNGSKDSPVADKNPCGHISVKPKVVVFPRQIAAVRSAYLNRLGSENIKKSPFSSDRHLTNLDLTSDHPSPDIPQAASLKTSPVVNELVVRRLMDDLSTSPAPYVAIIATDFRDTIFLAELVKRSLPTSQLILIEPHLMFARPEVAGFLRGALVASTYPLVSMTQKWTSPNAAESPIQFASDAQQGTFNATLAQLGSHRLRDYQPPSGSASESYPPVWMSLIGRDGFWPLATLGREISPCVSTQVPNDQPELLNIDQLDKQLAWCHHELRSPPRANPIYRRPRTEMPAEFHSLLLVFAILLPIAIGYTLFGKYEENLKPKFFPLAHLARTEGTFRKQRQLVLSLLAMVLLLMPYVWTYLVELVGESPSTVWLTRLIGVVGVVGGCFAALIAVTASVLTVARRPDFARPLSACTVVVGLLVASVAYGQQGRVGNFEPWALFIHRETAMLNGVSLLLPVLLLLLLAAIRSFTAICVDADQKRRPRELSFCEQVRSDWKKPGTLLVFIGLIFVSAAVEQIGSRMILPTGSLIVPAFLVLFTFMLQHAWVMTIRCWHRWKTVHQTLTHFGTMAFLPAFDRLPQQFTARLGLYLDGHRPGEWFTELRQQLVKSLPLPYQVDLNRKSRRKEPKPPKWLEKRWDKRDPLSQLRHQGQQAIAKLDELRKGRNREEYIADDIFALDVIDRLNWMARRLKFALAELLYTLIGLLLVVCSFPVPGQAYWIALFVTWLAMLGFGFIWIVLYCERDEVLSRIANTQPNRLSWSSEMIKSLAAYLIPVTLAIMSVFPEVYESIIVMFAPLWTMFVRN